MVRSVRGRHVGDGKPYVFQKAPSGSPFSRTRSVCAQRRQTLLLVSPISTNNQPRPPGKKKKPEKLEGENKEGGHAKSAGAQPFLHLHPLCWCRPRSIESIHHPGRVSIERHGRQRGRHRPAVPVPAALHGAGAGRGGAPHPPQREQLLLRRRPRHCRGPATAAAGCPGGSPSAR